MSRANYEERGMQAEWLRATDATRLIGIGRTKLWELSQSGSIKTARVGRAVRYSRGSLLSYMDQQAEIDTDK